MTLLYLLMLLCMLPHCGGSIQPKKSFHPVQQETKKRIPQSPHWDYVSHLATHDDMIKQGITIEQAIAIGIAHNSTLQALFDDIGIRKADLVQAGFYSNPHLRTIFRVPRECGDQTNIELSLTLKLSDLWQVPLRKNIAQDELERKTFELVDAILSLRTDIQKQCASIHYLEQILGVTREIRDQLIALRNDIYERYQFGYESDLDKHTADMKVGIWNGKIEEAHRMLRAAYAALYELLGTQVTLEPIKVRDHQSAKSITASVRELEDYALTTHPRILMARADIARAHHTISYEQSRIFDDVDIGFSYKRDLEKGHSGIGPALALNIPFFDLNYGNIERAKFEQNQAEKLLCAQQRHLHKDLLTHHVNYLSYLEQIKEYETSILPAATQAIAYTKTFSERMQLNTLVFLETTISFYEQKMRLLELQHQAINQYIELEHVVGASLDQIALRGE